MLLILQMICLFFMIKFALKRDCHVALRAFTLAIAIGQFFMPWVWVLAFIWGAICWGDARAEG